MSSDERPEKRPKRTYRACYQCRSRKLKCSFGDPNMPWDGPCSRCLREGRECVRSQPTALRDPPPRKKASDRPLDQDSERPSMEPQVVERTGERRRRRGSSSRPTSRPDHGENTMADVARNVSVGPPQGMVEMRGLPEGLRSDDPSDDERDSGPDGDNALVSSTLENPSDALRLLASASSLHYPTEGRRAQTPTPKRSGVRSNNATMWSAWEPIEQGILSVKEARALLSAFELEMAPLYPLLEPALFEPEYLDTLIKQESLLLGSILVIASRYTNTLMGDRGTQVHRKLSQWVRLYLLGVSDGDQTLRSVSTVEALLLLSEWPILPIPTKSGNGSDVASSEEAQLLRPSIRYDAYQWTYVGWAVRLAQELGLNDFANFDLKRGVGKGAWRQRRMLRTWVCCYNADRHIAVRLGRNAVLQTAMTSRWWEVMSDLVTYENRQPGSKDLWTSDLYMLASLAQLMGTVQNHLYANREVTRSLLRTGEWESFLRSVQLEIRYCKRACRDKLKDGSIEAAFLQVEFDYIVLYAYSLALRALQGKLRRRREANDLHYRSPSLLNLVEGVWIMEALSAAQSIIKLTLNVLHDRGILRYCPARIHHCILFATTFLYKALATGMVEHSAHNIPGMVDKAVTALGAAAIDNQHMLSGWAVLLKRLGKHWTESQSGTSPSILVRHSETRVGSPEPQEGGPRLSPNPLDPTVTTILGHSPSLPKLPLELDLGSANAQTQQQHQPPPQPQQQQPHQQGCQTVSPLSDHDFLWNFDPTFQMPDADHEQDMLFQSIWDNSLPENRVPTANLYATLLGDTLSFTEGTV